MKTKMLGSLIVIVLLCGCSRMHSNPFGGQATIDWVDFIKLNGNSYTGTWETVIKNPSDITDEVVGKVKFKVSDNVTNPGYRTKEGDAAFLEKGTKLYRVTGFKENELIAAKDEKRIGGYRLYAEDNFAKTMKQLYKDVPKNKVERVELYRFDETKPYKTLENGEKEQFIELLEIGKDTTNYTPQNKDGDPAYYKMVFYTDGPLAYEYNLADDGENVYFTPWDMRIVSSEIRTLISSTTAPSSSSAMESPLPMEAAKEDHTVRAIGKHSDGQLLVRPVSKASVVPLGAPSCYGQETDLNWSGTYEAVWESQAEGTASQLMVFPSDFEIIQQDESPIEMRKFNMGETDIFAYVPRYTDCHALETYLFGVSDGKAFPITFEMEPERIMMNIGQLPHLSFQVTDDEFILTGGYGAGQDFINVYHFQYDPNKKSMILRKTDQVKPNDIVYDQ